MVQLCEARPDLSGALFVSFGKSLGTKKRERRADKGAQNLIPFSIPKFLLGFPILISLIIGFFLAVVYVVGKADSQGLF